MNVVCLICRQYRPHEARGLCRTCYGKALAWGMLDRFPARPRAPLVQDEHTYRDVYGKKRRRVHEDL